MPEHEGPPARFCCFRVATFSFLELGSKVLQLGPAAYGCMGLLLGVLSKTLVESGCRYLQGLPDRADYLQWVG